MDGNLPAPAVHTADYMAETGEVWSYDKAAAYKDVFLEFLNYCVIPSKERGVITLGGQLYPAQERGLDLIFEGLQRGIHDFKWGKGRQQGISTICRPFSAMWIAMHKGSRGAFLLDTAFFHIWCQSDPTLRPVDSHRNSRSGFSSARDLRNDDRPSGLL